MRRVKIRNIRQLVQSHRAAAKETEMGFEPRSSDLECSVLATQWACMVHKRGREAARSGLNPEGVQSPSHRDPGTLP